MTDSRRLSWPDLEEPFATALREAVDMVETRVTAMGIIASGTILRGHPDPTSDLDIVVVHAEPFRQRLQQRFRGVPAEIFINPPVQLRRDFDHEHRLGRPIMAHMIATGHVVISRDQVVEALRGEAQALLAAGPPEDESVNRLRYLAATRFEDAVDRRRTDPVTAQLILVHAIGDMLRYFVRASGRFIPRDKDLLNEAGRLDAAVATVARDALETIGTDTGWTLGSELARGTIGVEGFYDWESAPEPIETPGSTV